MENVKGKLSQMTNVVTGPLWFIAGGVTFLVCNMLVGAIMQTQNMRLEFNVGIRNDQPVTVQPQSPPIQPQPAYYQANTPNPDSLLPDGANTLFPTQ